MFYSQGTISTVSGSAIVRGTGTRFKSNINGVAPGQVILIRSGNNNLLHMIQAVNSDTELVLADSAFLTLNYAKYQIQTTVPDSISDGVRHLVANNSYITQFLQNMDKWMTQNGTVSVTLPNGQTVSLQSIKALYAAMLDKNKNGADIYDKQAFVKNLGLAGTVDLAKNAVPNSRKVNGKALTGDVTLSAEDVQGEPRFNTTIDLTGLSSDRYYPVWWRFPSNGIGANPWLAIHRNYAEDRGDKNPFGLGKDEAHLAGLLLQIEGGDNPWGGDAQYLNIKRISQTYRKTVKNIRYKMMSIARPHDGKFSLLHNLKSGDITYCEVFSGCYLRGGLTYHVTSNFSGIYSSNKEGEVEISSWSNDQDKEIKWMVKSYAIDDPLLGKEYDDTVLPYAHDYAETINLAKNAYPKTGGKIEGKVDVSSDIEATGWIGGKELWERKSDGGWVRAYSPQNKPTAEEIKVEPRFNTTIDLTGLSSNRYYPVWWRFPSNDIGANPWLTIHRNYAEDWGDKNPFGLGKDETHLAGLLLQIEGGDNPWGGDAQYLNIKRINQTYRKTVKNIRYKMMSIARPLNGKFPLLHNLQSGGITYCEVLSGCYLRGGLTYHVTSNFSGIHYSHEEGEIEISRWSDGHEHKQEIKWTVKSYAIDDPLLGAEYDDTIFPYSHDIIEFIKKYR
ncbi:hypothetical protein [Xenorhabdus taiwanensis]|uniref:Tail fiber protein n=1 Tax=Xenorhabdus taiwanensis TaxID=3085177 RepID=A0ABM8JYM8_9GAMM|nr:hypothetical protein TCT1_27400 [Xenorhabdus sp. TCT-1]